MIGYPCGHGTQQLGLGRHALSSAAYAHLHTVKPTAAHPIGAGTTGEASSEARSASPPQGAGSPGTARPPLAQPAGASTRRLSALAPPSAHSSGAADIPADTTRLASGTMGLATVSEHSESPQSGTGRLSQAGDSPPPGAGPGPRAGAALATAGLVVQPPGTFSTAQSPFARMVASHAAARGAAGGPPAPDPRNMYNTALEALRAKAMGPPPLAVQSEPVCKGLPTTISISDLQ